METIICSLVFKKWHRFCRARICRFIFPPARNPPPPPRVVLPRNEPLLLGPAPAMWHKQWGHTQADRGGRKKLCAWGGVVGAPFPDPPLQGSRDRDPRQADGGRWGVGGPEVSPHMSPRGADPFEALSPRTPVLFPGTQVPLSSSVHGCQPFMPSVTCRQPSILCQLPSVKSAVAQLWTDSVVARLRITLGESRSLSHVHSYTRQSIRLNGGPLCVGIVLVPDVHHVCGQTVSAYHMSGRFDQRAACRLVGPLLGPLHDLLSR